MIIEVNNEQEMQAFGEKLGAILRGGDVIELIGDVGAGKTTLTKGIARGLAIDETIQSPTFTISRVYDTPNQLRLAHYDFYRLQDAGIMANELDETLYDPATITIIEWAGVVQGVLPEDHVMITIVSPTETSRRIELRAGGTKSQRILDAIV